MGKLVYLRYFLFVLLTLCYQNEADIDAVNVTCNEAWVHLHGNAFITFVVSATIICHITFKKPHVCQFQVLINLKIYQMTLNLYTRPKLNFEKVLVC